MRIRGERPPLPSDFPRLVQAIQEQERLLSQPLCRPEHFGFVRHAGLLHLEYLFDRLRLLVFGA